MIWSQQFFTAMPYKSVETEAAVGVVLGTLSVLVSEIWTFSIGTFRQYAHTYIAHGKKTTTGIYIHVFSTLSSLRDRLTYSILQTITTQEHTFNFVFKTASPAPSWCAVPAPSPCLHE